MKRSLMIPLAPLLLALVSTGCRSTPRSEGFTNLTIPGSRADVAPGSGNARIVTWGSLDLSMAEDGPVLATIENLHLALEPDGSGTRLTLTGTLRAKGYCTSSSWNHGIGQVVQIFLENADNALLQPWTAGALHVQGGQTSEPFSFVKTLPALRTDAPAKAELVVQPALWVKCP